MLNLPAESSRLPGHRYHHKDREPELAPLTGQLSEVKSRNTPPMLQAMASGQRARKTPPPPSKIRQFRTFSLPPAATFHIVRRRPAVSVHVLDPAFELRRLPEVPEHYP